MSPLYKMLYEKLERNKTSKQERKEKMKKKKARTYVNNYNKLSV